MVQGGLPLLLLALAAQPACATGGPGSQPGCTTSADCPSGQVCVEGVCRGGSDADADADGDEDGTVPDGEEVLEDADGDGDGTDGETVDVPPPTPVVTGFAVTGGAISGTNAEYRYQFSVGAPQPVGSGTTAEGGWTFGPGGVHRR